MAVRFGKTVFSTYVIGDDRAPLLTNVDPDEGDVGNPDPGGPGGSDPGGGDIGSPTGGGVVTSTLPTITRKSHSSNIYAAKGAAVSVTYVADQDCTMMTKWGYEDMVISYTDDGREMTVSWTVPANEPSDSTPLGVEAFIYGGDDDTDYSTSYVVLWDILHVGKTASDILTAVSANSLRSNMSRMTSPNHTLVVPNSVRTAWDDELGIRDPTRAFQDNPVNGSFTESGTGLEKTYTVTTNAVIISETPLGTELDRAGQRGGVYVNGTIPEFSGSSVGGNSRAVAIKVKGFLIRNASFGGVGMNKAEKCAIDGCHVVQDMRIGELNTFWAGNGGANGVRSSLDCNIEYGGSLANERFGCIMSFTINEASRRSRFSKMQTTMGSVQLTSEGICQDYSYYGSIEGASRNCLAIDDILFADGARRNGTTDGINYNFAFINTNGANYSTTISRCASLNNLKALFWNNNNSTLDSTKSLVRHSIGAIKRDTPRASIYQAFNGGHFNIERCTLGHYEKHLGFSAIYDFGLNDITGLLIVHPSWDVQIADAVMGGNSRPNFSGIGIVNPPDNLNEYIQSLDDYYVYASIEAAGIKYWTRVEDGGSAQTAGLGVEDFWCTEGRYGKFEADNDTTVYNGDGVPYVNWMQRGPWYERQQANQSYSHTTSEGTVFSGAVGINEPGVHPVDYLHRKGVSPLFPTNCPYIEDIYHKVLSNGTVRLWWRPVCPKYRGTIVGYDFYVDGVRVAENQNKRYTRFDIENLNSGTRKIWIVCVDTTHGNSGHSRKITAVIP